MESAGADGVFDRSLGFAWDAHTGGSKKRKYSVASQESTCVCSEKLYDDLGFPGQREDEAGQSQFQADLAKSRTD